MRAIPAESPVPAEPPAWLAPDGTVWVNERHPMLHRHGAWTRKMPDGAVELLPRTACVAERAAADELVREREDSVSPGYHPCGVCAVGNEVCQYCRPEPAADVVERCARAVRDYLFENVDINRIPADAFERMARAVLAAAHPGPDQSCACTIPGCQCQVSDGT